MAGLPVFHAPDNGELTDDMIAAFDQAGVIILRNAISTADCDRLRQRALDLVDAFNPEDVRHVFSTLTQTQINDDYFNESGGAIRFFLEEDAFDDTGRLKQSKENSLNKMGHAMHDLDPVFDQFSHRESFAEMAKRLGVQDAGVLQSMYIFKPPHIGGEVICHQDSTFLYTEPETCLGFWFALEDATTENGCMRFIPGAHKEPLRARHYRQPDGSYRTERLVEADFPADQALPAEARKGDLVIFHGRAPHMSGANHSDRSRHAYTLHAIDRGAHYPAENWLQRGDDMPLRGFDGH